ncbi:hypothetical protein VDS40_22800, partial [Xanthomonas campestris pv. campestris]|nr:hypothetical protein [Xanthomonas campestris pv. campestris]
MGLKLIRARNNRKAKMGAKSASFPLEEFTTGFGTHRGIVDVMTWYVVDSDSWSRTAELAARRNSRRVLDAVPRESADDRYWHEVRREIMARAMSADEAARLIWTKCRAQQEECPQRDSKGRTYGARVAAAWLQWV